MKGTGDRRLPIQPTFYFQRRTERLDWKKIASLDIHKLVQEGDTSQLKEFISPILFCKAESEFDSQQDKTDPGFIKVFRLSQLIGEYFISCHEKDKNKLRSCEIKCAELEEEKGKLSLELGDLKESLLGTKRELKKTKDMLASTQKQVLGTDNHDEFDQCPYCTKRFLTLFYLQAHIQRRHQGLPLPLAQFPNQSTSLFPLQIQHSGMTTFSPKIVPGLVGTPTVYAFTMGSSSNGNVTENPNQTPDLNLNQNQNFYSPEHEHNNGELHNSLQKRRDSSTQTFTDIFLQSGQPVNTTSDGELGLLGNDQNGNILGVSDSSIKNRKTMSSTSYGNSDSVSVIKSPCRNTNEECVHDVSGIRNENPRKTTTDNSTFQVSSLDLNTICDLVEKFLEQKSVASQNQHYDKILESIYNSRARDSHGFQPEFHLHVQKSHGFDPSASNTNTFNKMDHRMDLAVSGSRGSHAPTPEPLVPRSGQEGNGSLSLERLEVTSVPCDTNATATDKDGNGKSGDKRNFSLDTSGEEFERIERNVMRMKDEFETKWTHLSEKVRDSGIQELRQAFLTEIKKVQEMILKCPTPKPQAGFVMGSSSCKTRTLDDEDIVRDNKSSPTPDPNPNPKPIGFEMELMESKLAHGTQSQIQFKEMCQNQEMRFQELTSKLQAKLQKELDNVQGKLETQDELWRSKLQALEQEHEHHIAEVRKAKVNKKKPEELDSDNQLKLRSDSKNSYNSNSIGEKTSVGVETGDYLPFQLQAFPLPPISQPQPPQARARGEGKISVISSSPNASVIQVSMGNKQLASEFSPEEKSISRGPVAKPRRPRGEDGSEISSGRNSGHITNNISGGRENRESREGILTNAIAKRGITQSLPVHEDFGLGLGDAEGSLIPSDPDAEYLTIIHVEREAENLDYATTTTSKPKTAFPTKAPSIRAWMGSKPQIHEYEEPLNVHNIDEVSDYTLSTSAQGVRPDLSGESISTDASSGSESSDYDDLGGGGPLANATARRGVNGTNDTEKFRKRYAEPKNSKGKKKYVFDSTQGKIIDACETRSQMDLVRDRIVLNEMDKQMEELGINPEASSIGMEEMAMALKHLKKDRRSLHVDPQKFESERNTLNKDVKYEVAKRSIHQKLEKYGVLNKKAASPLLNIFSKVKNSSSTWRNKVALAMKRKRESPSKSQKEKSGDTDIKTTFFSKWGRKKKANTSKEETTREDSESELDSSEDEESSGDIEMPPFMTRSQPVFHSPRGRGRNAMNKRKKKLSNSGSTKDKDSLTGSGDEDENVGFGLPPKSQHLKKPISKPHSPGPERYQHPVKREMISELKSRFSQHQHKEQHKGSPGLRMKSQGTYKGPNFFVHGSPKVSSPSANRGNTNGPNTNDWGSGVSVSSANREKSNSLPISKRGKKENAFRRDLLQEFQQSDEFLRQSNFSANNGGGGNGSKFNTIRAGSGSGSGPGYVQVRDSHFREKVPTNTDAGRKHGKYMEPESDVDEDVRGKKSFARSDDMRKGFRNRKSSYSYSEEDDGQPPTAQNPKSLPRRSLQAEEDHYATLRYPDSSPKPPKSKSSHSATPLKSRMHPNEPKRLARSNSNSSVNSSDTSVWETEEEEEVDESCQTENETSGFSKSRFKPRRTKDNYSTTVSDQHSNYRGAEDTNRNTRNDLNRGRGTNENDLSQGSISSTDFPIQTKANYQHQSKRQGTNPNYNSAQIVSQHQFSQKEEQSNSNKKNSKVKGRQRGKGTRSPLDNSWDSD